MMHHDVIVMSSQLITDLPCHPSPEYSQRIIDLLQEYRKPYRDAVMALKHFTECHAGRSAKTILISALPDSITIGSSGSIRTTFYISKNRRTIDSTIDEIIDRECARYPWEHPAIMYPIVIYPIRTYRKAYRMQTYDRAITSAFYFPKGVNSVKIYLSTAITINVNISDCQPSVEQMLTEARQIPKCDPIKENIDDIISLESEIIRTPPTLYDKVPIVVPYGQETIEFENETYYRTILIHPFIPSEPIRGYMSIEFENDITFLVEKIYNTNIEILHERNTTYYCWIPNATAEDHTLLPSLYGCWYGSMYPIFLDTN